MATESYTTTWDVTQPLLDAKVRVSRDGRGRWMENVMIERLWRSLKYECAYLHAFETGPRPGLASANGRPTTTPSARIRLLGGKTLMEAHQGPDLRAAA